MKHHYSIILLGLLSSFTFSACERMPDTETSRPELAIAPGPVESRVEEGKPATVQEALKADAQLARTMSLQEFVDHMQTRTTYYSQFKEVDYEDDFVKIRKDGEKLKVETAEGKAK
ncbi:hypothetical protein ACMA1I_16475 [Pontibacter sp. 13R65]|uniref:hypothetical protein n=1 Tax=Pontibacter sp. 13R65 TaxID=3127458 RepID=UPI00301CE3E4